MICAIIVGLAGGYIYSFCVKKDWRIKLPAGVPIVMNLYLLVTFVIFPTLVGIASYLLMQAGILPLFSGVMVPWTTPPIISGFLIGGWRTALWQFAIIVFSAVVYWPFIKKYDEVLVSQQNQEK